MFAVSPVIFAGNGNKQSANELLVSISDEEEEEDDGDDDDAEEDEEEYDDEGEPEVKNGVNRESD